MPLLDGKGCHWLLMTVDCLLWRFLVYNSLACVGDESRDVLLTSATVGIAVALLRTSTLGDALRWDMARVECVQQDNGYDCGVFVMAFMDLISVRADSWCFQQQNVRHFKEKCLANLLKGDIRNFPCYAKANRMRTKLHHHHHRRLRRFPFIILVLTVEKC